MRNSLHQAGSSAPVIATALEVLRLRRQWPRLNFSGACSIKRLASFGFSEEQAMTAWLAEAPDEQRAYERSKISTAARTGAIPVAPALLPALLSSHAATSPATAWAAGLEAALPKQVPSCSPVKLLTRAFCESSYLAAYDRIPAPTHAYMLLEKVHRLCRLFAALKDGSDAEWAMAETDAFFDRLQCGIGSRRGHLGDVGKVATRLWSSEAILKLDCCEYEFCHVLNEVLRRDVAGEMLDSAVLVARGINRLAMRPSRQRQPMQLRSQHHLPRRRYSEGPACLVRARQEVPHRHVCGQLVHPRRGGQVPVPSGGEHRQGAHALGLSLSGAELHPRQLSAAGGRLLPQRARVPLAAGLRADGG